MKEILKKRWIVGAVLLLPFLGMAHPALGIGLLMLYVTGYIVWMYVE
jgi:hypothetical protein